MGYKIKRILVGTQQVRPAGWTPGSNTIAYYPLNGDTNDESGNGHNLSNSNITFTTIGDVECAYCNGSSLGIANISENLSGFTLSCWVNTTSTTDGMQFTLLSTTNGNVGVFSGNNGVGSVQNIVYLNNSWVAQGRGGGGKSGWFNVIYTIGLNENKICINGEDVVLTYSYGNSSSGLSSSVTFNRIVLGKHPDVNANQYVGYIADYIVENRVWNSEEKTNYYNQTKSNYGL